MPPTVGPHTWQKVEGAESAELCAWIRKPDVLCSNSFLLRTPAYLVLIDPGADADQSADIFRQIQAEMQVSPRPVLILLTHCHRDHALAVNDFLRPGSFPCFVLAQAAGADALQRGDPALTLACIFSESFPPTRAHVALFPDAPAESQASGVWRLGQQTEIVFTTESLPPRRGGTIRRHSLRLGPGNTLEIYHTPGHSPDSLCARIGRLMFTGDLLFAEKPGIAGIPGWSKDALLQSLDSVAFLLEGPGVEWVYSGHGKMLPAAQALVNIATARKQTAALGPLARLDAERARFLKRSVIILLEKASLLFAVIGGRLGLLAERLDLLGEDGRAQEIRRQIKLDAVETFLEEFHQYVKNCGAGPLLMAVPLKGVAIIGKIKQALADTRLPGLIEPALLQRVDHLLRSVVSLVLGQDPQAFAAPLDLAVVLQEAIDQLKPAPDEQAQWAAAESPEAFLEVLTRRLAGHSRLKTVLITLAVDGAPPAVPVIRERLNDLVRDILEQMALASPREIHIRVSRQGPRVRADFETNPGCRLEWHAQQMRFYEVMGPLLGAEWMFHGPAGRPQISLAWPVGP